MSKILSGPSRCCTSTKKVCPTAEASVRIGAAPVSHSLTPCTKVPYAVFTATTKESKFPTHTGLFGGYSQTVVPAICVVETNAIDHMREGKVALPDSDYDLVRDKPFGGEIVMEHQARPARIVSQGEIICSSTQAAAAVMAMSLSATPTRSWKTSVQTRYRERPLVVFFASPLTTGRCVSTSRAPSGCAKRSANAAVRSGKPYAEFVKEWSKKCPHEQALKFFGSWPDAKPNRMVVRI